MVVQKEITHKSGQNLNGMACMYISRIDFEFHKDSNAAVASKNIGDVYPNLSVRSSWFSEFRSSNLIFSTSKTNYSRQ